MMASIFMMAFLFTAFTTNAQTKKKSAAMKDCCTMMDGKMMSMKNGKMVPMKKDMKMTNGTTCMTNGDCKMKNGKMMKMNNGDCMDMNGKMCSEEMKKYMMKKDKMAMAYACPMHPEVQSNKPGKCSKCGMNLEKKGSKMAMEM